MNKAQAVGWYGVLSLLLLKGYNVLSKSTNDIPTTTIQWSTRLGPVLGLNVTSDNGSSFQFKGIPFAKPPIGDLRFRKPEVPNAWSGILNCTTYMDACMQSGTHVSEDCLYLNVFVPNSLDASAKRAVMVWIHGGSFISGSGSGTDGSALALHGDVIVVTINYRLNIFGFFTTGDNSATGNYGLWDQMLALQWVKNNIGDFGGDTTRITIIGESAGGASVGMLAIIPQNRGLFQRVIAESGSCVGPRDSGVESMKVFARVVNELGCSSNSSVSTVTCLRRQSAGQLGIAFYTAFIHVQNASFTILSALGPTIDGELFIKDFEAILTDHNSDAMKFFRDLDLLTGLNSAESGLFYFDLLRHQKVFPKFNFTVAILANIPYNNVIPTLVRQLYDNCDAIFTSIADKYVEPVTSGDAEDQTSSVSNLYADVNYNSPAFRSLDAHIGASTKTYQYLFSHEPRWGLVRPRPLWLHGANHADELPFVFGLNEFYPSNILKDDDELAISRRVMTYWTNFAKSGNPNGNDSDLLEWPQYTLPNKSFLNISVTDSVGHALWADRMEFWNKDVPSQLRRCRATSGVSSLMTIDMLISVIICSFLILYKFI
ncbi:carboxylesterase 5A-like [Mizuhopecten yessoensis]|uniref:carboxylesterase 5A-like n=1 Tax=Mizuhopecten yessoensis TaxID=6573 RepID=UPI000B459F16|nr:carboxylesterase 5A-like [Mizuhopecten yessoensis]